MPIAQHTAISRNKMAASSGQFRANVWDPILIISQIIAVQFTFYFFLGVWLVGLDQILGRSVILSQLFDGQVCIKILGPFFENVFRKISFDQ